MRTRTLLIALPLLLGSCGGGGADVTETTNAGHAALGSQDWSGARDEFRAALDAIGGDTGHAQYLRAKMGLVEALAHVDPGAAVQEFQEAVDAGAPITDREYSLAGNKLMEAKAHSEAVQVMDSGLKTFPDSQQLAQLKERVLAAAEGSPEVSEQLKGLGYLSD